MMDVVVVVVGAAIDVAAGPESADVDVDVMRASFSSASFTSRL